MIKLPKLNQNPKDTEHLCKCRPVCMNRRREWKGQVPNTSAELLLERKPVAECFKRWPTKVKANSPCPLFNRSRRVTVKERNASHITNVVRICQAPVDDTAYTPYLEYAEMAKRLGAWDTVSACCAFCECGACCPCGVRQYVLRDAERAERRRDDMRDFDARVRTGCHEMRIMYDKPL